MSYVCMFLSVQIAEVTIRQTLTYVVKFTNGRLSFSLFYFSFLFYFWFIFYFLFLEQLGLGVISHAVTSVTI